MTDSKSRSESIDYDNIAMDSSVLGDETMASLEGRRNEEFNPLTGDLLPYRKRLGLNPYNAQDTDTDTEAGYLPTNMAYVGDTDDISTIANDTMAADSQTGSITKLFPSISIRKNGPRTSERQTKSSFGDETAPETFGDSAQFAADKDSDEVQERSSFSKVKYYWAAFFAMFLVGAIAALTYGLMSLRDQNIGPTQLSATSDREWDWTFKPTPLETVAPTITPYPTMQPTTLRPSSAPSSPPSMAPSTATPSSTPTTASPSRTPTSTPTLSQAPTHAPSSTPTIAPTRTPTMSPTASKEANFTLVLAQISASSLDAIGTPASPQRRAFKWITDDPDYFSYSEDRIIQRWVLAVFSVEVSTSRRNRRLNAALNDWMEYTDECRWFITDDEIEACDEEGVFKSLVLEDIGLDGTIPSELFLLDRLSELSCRDCIGASFVGR